MEDNLLGVCTALSNSVPRRTQTNPSIPFRTNPRITQGVPGHLERPQADSLPAPARQPVGSRVHSKRKRLPLSVSRTARSSEEDGDGGGLKVDSLRRPIMTSSSRVSSAATADRPHISTSVVGVAPLRCHNSTVLLRCLLLYAGKKSGDSSICVSNRSTVVSSRRFIISQDSSFLKFRPLSQVSTTALLTVWFTPASDENLDSHITCKQVTTR